MGFHLAVAVYVFVTTRGKMRIFRNRLDFVKEAQRTHQILHMSAKPKWNLRRWRGASFLCFQYVFLPSLQSPHSYRSPIFERKPSYALPSAKPPEPSAWSISLRSRVRNSASLVTPCLNTTSIQPTADAFPPRRSHDPCSLTASGSNAAAGSFPGLV